MASKKIECKCTDKERGIFFNGVDASVCCSVCGKTIIKFIDLKLSKLLAVWHILPNQLQNEIRENVG